MKNENWIGIIAAIVVFGAIFFWLISLDQRAGRDQQPSDGLNNNGEDVGDLREEVSAILAKLPNNFTAGQRSIVMDRQTITGSERASYSRRDASTLPSAGEDPVEYLERVIRIRLEREEVVSQPEAFSFLSSFYEMDGAIVAFLHVSRLPDDSVGASEERFEFTREGGEWKLDWYGMRNFCRRPIPGKWLKADELCP